MNYYYVAADNQVRGPLTEQQVISLLVSGTLTADSLVCPEGGREWSRLGTVFHASPSAATPVPPPPRETTIRSTPNPKPTKSRTSYTALLSMLFGACGCVALFLIGITVYEKYKAGIMYRTLEEFFNEFKIGLYICLGCHVLAIIFGHTAKSLLKNNSHLRGNDLAKYGLCLGYLPLRLIGWAFTAAFFVLKIFLSSNSSSSSSPSNQSNPSNSSDMQRERENEKRERESERKKEQERMERETIGTAVQKGSLVYVYNIRGSQLSSHSGSLQGYTSGTVSVRKGSLIYTYNAQGSQISSHSTS